MPTVAEQLRAALKRPCARIEGDYSEPLKIPRPYFGAFHSVSMVLAARAKCDLMVGKTDAALDELTFLNRFRQVLDLRPSGKPTTFIIAMSEIVFVDRYVKTILDGQQKHAWNDEQLASLQSQLQQINLPQRVSDTIRAEIPWDCCLFETDVIPHLGRKHLLEGWILQNLVTLTTYNEQAINVIDLSSDTVSPAKLDGLERQREQFYSHHASPGNFLAMIIFPEYKDVLQTTAYNQTLVNETQVVCALERYRLGEYPETLDALIPRFAETIPHDIIGGQQLHYRRMSGGKYLLYSVGWNQTDDGGQESPKDENGSIEYTNGDWVLEN